MQGDQLAVPAQLERLCINTDKVYDWIIAQANVDLAAVTLTFPVGATDPCAVGTTILDVTTSITELSFTEVGTRTSRTFIIDGAEVVLERVTIQKTLSITVTITGTTAAGLGFTITSLPVTQVISESFFLCAPEGTVIDVEVTDVSSTASGTCVAGAFVASISALVCQSIQVTAPVTLELTADFCMPREDIVATCPAPTIPPQCPAIFPPSVM